MFRLRRRKQQSYWYLSETQRNEEADDGVVPVVSQLRCLAESPVTQDTSSENAKSNIGTPMTSDTKINLQHALALQSKWTSWPSSIWELNLDDADGEIVFSEEGAGNDLDYPLGESSCKKSVGTVDTEDTMPSSSCSSPDLPWSSPELQPDWDIDLSAILHEDDQQDETALFRHFFLDTSDALNSPRHHHVGDSNSFSIEESVGTLTSFRKQQLSAKPRRLRFADEEGGAMETVHFVDQDDEDDSLHRKVLVLMLLPEQKKFEFIHAEYSTDPRSQLTVSDLLDQLPGLASDPVIKQQQHTRLCRAAGGRELINALPIQSYDLPSNEILVAVLKGYTGESMLNMAKALVDDERILRAVKRTNKSAHTLHRLECNYEACHVADESNEGTAYRKDSFSQKVRQSKLRIQTNTQEATSWLGATQCRECDDINHFAVSNEQRDHNPEQISSRGNNLQYEVDSSASIGGLGSWTTLPMRGKAREHRSGKKSDCTGPYQPHAPKQSGDKSTMELYAGSKPVHGKRSSLFGRAALLRIPSPPMAAQQSSSQSGATSFFRKKIFFRLPSPTRAPQRNGEGAGSKNMERRQSPGEKEKRAVAAKETLFSEVSQRKMLRNRTAQSSRSKEGTSNPGKASWTNRFSNTRWAKLNRKAKG